MGAPVLPSTGQRGAASPAGGQQAWAAVAGLKLGASFPPQVNRAAVSPAGCPGETLIAQDLQKLFLKAPKCVLPHRNPQNLAWPSPPLRPPAPHPKTALTHSGVWEVQDGRWSGKQPVMLATGLGTDVCVPQNHTWEPQPSSRLYLEQRGQEPLAG